MSEAATNLINRHLASDTNTNANVNSKDDVDEEKEKKKKVELPPPAPASCQKYSNEDILYIGISVVLGFAFGFILEKSKVYEPKSIRQQMIFQKFIMMKMFFTALATSMLSIFILTVTFKDRYFKVMESYRDTLKSKSLLIICAGGLILGLGMQIGGSCPGMMFVQFGAGVNYSLFTLIGGLSGALVHGLLNTYLTHTSVPDPIASKTFYEIFNAKQPTLRAAFIGALAFAIILMELFIPWYTEYEVIGDAYSVSSAAWPPIFAGFLLGSLQFFSLLLLTKSLGSIK